MVGPDLLLNGRIAALALAGLAGCAAPDFTCEVSEPPAVDPGGAETPTVILLALDGFGAGLLDRFATPGLDHLGHLGTRAERLVPVFPTETAPNFASLATGVFPESHGILGNTFLDPPTGLVYRDGREGASPEGGWNLAEPLWETLRGAGLRTASFDWPASGGWPGEDGPTIDCRSLLGGRNGWIADHLARVLDRRGEERPHLALLYLGAVDAAAHRYGTDEPALALRLGVQRADRLVRALLEQVSNSEGEVHLLVVSDHGLVSGTGTTRVVLDSLLDLTQFRLVTSGAYSALWLRADAPADIADRVIALRDADLPLRVLQRGRIPTAFSYRSSPRAPDFLLLAEVGTVVGTRSGLAQTNHPGVHGYTPSVPSMWGLLFAAGPRIRPGSNIPSASMVDVHVLVLELLGVAAGDGVDGSAAAFTPVLCRRACRTGQEDPRGDP